MRTVLAFLALLPMLMPPGMCICRLAPVVRAAPNTQSVVSDNKTVVAHDTNAKSGCSCDSCRSQTSPVAGTDRTNPPTTRDESPSEEPFKHSPSCPAATDATPLTLLVQPTTIPHDAVATLNFLTPVHSLFVFAVRPASSTMRTSAPPLFISHCALLI